MEITSSVIYTHNLFEIFNLLYWLHHISLYFVLVTNFTIFIKFIVNYICVTNFKLVRYTTYYYTHIIEEGKVMVILWKVYSTTILKVNSNNYVLCLTLVLHIHWQTYVYKSPYLVNSSLVHFVYLFYYKFLVSSTHTNHWGNERFKSMFRKSYSFLFQNSSVTKYFIVVLRKWIRIGNYEEKIQITKTFK